MNCLRNILLLSALLLTACATDGPSREPSERGTVIIEDREPIRRPAPDWDRREIEEPEPEPEPPPRERPSKAAVIALIDRADALDREGKTAEAAAQLDRALRLDPRDARLLQRRAELFMAMDQAAQAETYAHKSYQLSVKYGALCRRNWETISRARRAQGDRSGSSAALERKQDC